MTTTVLRARSDWGARKERPRARQTPTRSPPRRGAIRAILFHGLLMPPLPIARIRRTLAGLAVFAALWTAGILATGGFVFTLFGSQISSRNPRNPFAIAVMCAIGAWALPMPNRAQVTREFWMRSRQRWRRVAERRPAWLDLSLVAAIVGVFAAIDAWDNARPLWLDEEMIGLNARHRTFTELAGALWMNQSTPLGWLALQRLAILTFGTGELALRLVALTFGLGTLVVAVWASRRWLQPAAGGLFVLLCAIGPWLAHYPLEAKHYSADVFWALLLPMLAVWVVESPEPRAQIQRSRVWWFCAVVGHWSSIGGLLVVPASAIVLLLGMWQRQRWRGVVEVTTGGLVLLASFAVHFMLSIRHTLANEYLQEFWSIGMLPSGLGVGGSLEWFAGQLGPLAGNPIGTEKWLLFWVTAAAGCVAAPSRFPLILIAIAASAVLLSGMRMVPMVDRQALWIVPALYFAVASALHRSIELLRRGYRMRHALHFGVAIAMAALSALTAIDLIDRGWAGVQFRRFVVSNRGLDDRTAVAWLLSQHRPGDAIVTTQFGLPSIWWYGDIDIRDRSGAAGRLGDGTPIFEASHLEPHQCTHDRGTSALDGYRRVVVYLSFRDFGEEFPDLLVSSLRRGGVVISDRTFATLGRVAVIERAQDSPSIVLASGCIDVRPARRW